MKRRAALALLLLALPPASTQAADGGDDLRAGLTALRAQDERVASVAWRLATANLPLCQRHAPLLGFSVHEPAQYVAGVRPAAMAAFGLGAGPSVLAVAAGSAAARAGLRADDRLVAINGQAIVATPPGTGADYAGVAAIEARLDRAAAAGAVTLGIERGGRQIELRIRPAQGCASAVQLVPEAKRDAWADGRYVQITSAMADFVASDDELAIVIGHEMAHNILGHRAALDAQGVPSGLFARFGANARKVRATEIAADRFGLFLAARAGYDLAAAPAFWRRFGRKQGLGIFADRTHPDWRERVERINATIAAIEATCAAGRELRP